MAQFQAKQLENAFNECIEALGRACMDFPWDNKEAYAYWLSQTYFYVKHTTCFLALVSAKLGLKNREKQYHALEHLKDELNHDEVALNDLKALGKSIDQFPEFPETSAFYQGQYFYIQNHSPVSHLGYSLCLEGLAAKKIDQFYPIVEKAYGKKACTFLHLHCVVDKDHFEHGLEAFKDMNEEETQLVTKNLRQSTAMYCHMLDAIKRKLGIKQTGQPMSKSA